MAAVEAFRPRRPGQDARRREIPIFHDDETGNDFEVPEFGFEAIRVLNELTEDGLRHQVRVGRRGSRHPLGPRRFRRAVKVFGRTVHAGYRVHGEIVYEGKDWIMSGIWGNGRNSRGFDKLYTNDFKSGLTTQSKNKEKGQTSF